MKFKGKLKNLWLLGNMTTNLIEKAKKKKKKTCSVALIKATVTKDGNTVKQLRKRHLHLYL